MKNLNSKLFEKLENNKLKKTHLIFGGQTSRKDDCNASSYDNDNSKWKNDSSKESDTERSSDGCNADFNYGVL